MPLVLLLLLLSHAAAGVSRLGAQPAPTGRIVGTVTDAETGRPLVSVQVGVVGATLGAVSDSAGRFTIPGVPVGTRAVRAVRIGLRPVVLTDLLVNADRSTQVALEMRETANTLGNVQVVASAATPVTLPRIPNSRISMSYEEIRRSPGAIGDVSRLVQSLPGVLTGNDTRNDIIARGGSPSENLMLLDGIEVPNINHFAVQGSTGGPIGMINNELLRDAAFVAGGFSSQYGNRLSSMLDIKLREGNRDAVRTELDLSNAGAGLIAEGPLGSKGSFIMSGRQSFLSLIAPALGLTAIPYTTNFQTKLTYEPTTLDRLWVVGLGGFDRIDFESTADDTDDPDPLGTTRVRGDRWTGGLGWQHLFGSRAYGTMILSGSTLARDVRVVETELGTAPAFENVARENEFTARYDVHLNLGRVGTVIAGASAKSLTANTLLASPYGVQNPFTTIGRVDPVGIDTSVTTSIVGGYLEYSRSVGRRLDVTLSGRVEQFLLSEVSRFAPRAAAVVHLSPTLDLTGTWGRYFQQVPLVYAVNIPSNAGLIPMRADHAIGGLAWTPREDLKVTLEGYAKSYGDYPVARDFPELSLANTGDQVNLAQGSLTALESRGEGWVRGVEFFVQKKFNGRNYGQFSYAYSQTRHSAKDGIERRGAFDVPHLATAILGQKRGSSWEYSTRASYGTGRPITPLLAATSQAQNRLVYDMRRFNEERTSDYIRIDLRVDRRFRVRGGTLATYLELQNISGRENQSVQEWNTKTRQAEFQDQIAFLPVFGLNWKF